MKTIWKFPIDVGRNLIQMPKRAVLISCGKVGLDKFIWAIVDDQNELEDRRVFVVGTGWDLKEGIPGETMFMHLGTIMDEPFVWHVFYRPGPVEQRRSSR